MISLGIFKSVNIWPLYYEFLFGKVPPAFRLVPGTPEELNRFLAEGKLEASSISSIQYPFIQDEIFLLPSFALATQGEVQSVVLLAKRKLEKLSSCIVFATASSLTSRVLLHILLSRRTGSFKIKVSKAPKEAFEKGGDAALLIGDEALQAREAFKEKFFIYDLGEMWENLTGKPLVWALWGIRKESLSCAPELMKAFEESRKNGLDALPFLAQQASAKLGLSSGFLEKYYRAFDYHFREEHFQGLQLFYHLAHELQMAPQCRSLSFLNDHRPLAASCTA